MMIQAWIWGHPVFRQSQIEAHKHRSTMIIVKTSHSYQMMGIKGHTHTDVLYIYTHITYIYIIIHTVAGKTLANRSVIVGCPEYVWRNRWE